MESRRRMVAGVAAMLLAGGLVAAGIVAAQGGRVPQHSTHSTATEAVIQGRAWPCPSGGLMLSGYGLRVKVLRGSSVVAMTRIPLGYIRNNRYDFRFAVPAGTYTIRASNGKHETLTVGSGKTATVHVSTVCRGFPDA